LDVVYNFPYDKIGVFTCSFVKFKTPLAALAGTWDPYPIAMEFKPPCMVLSTIGFGGVGKIGVTDVNACPLHLHQLHVCMPASRGKTRLLYRMGLDWWPFMKHIPYMSLFWQTMANRVRFYFCIHKMASLTFNGLSSLVLTLWVPLERRQ
jgi:hypothetical protein